MKEKHFKATRIIHFALLIGLIFYGFTVGLLNDFQFPDQPYNDIFLIINTILLLLIPAGFYIRKNKIDRISPKASATKRIAEIKSANIILWAMFEGVGFYSLNGILLINHYIHLIYALICLVALIITRPRSDIFD